jgi:hypothetical protein
MKKILVILPLLFFTQAGSASRYDPDCKVPTFRVDRGMFGKGPVWIISWLLPPAEVKRGVDRCSSGWNLEINYSGYLTRDRSCDPKSFAVGVKLNSKGFHEFPLAKTVFDGRSVYHISLHQPSKIRRPRSRFDPYLEDLFFWAFNQYGRLNNWDIEVYFKANCSGSIRYDSRFGQNYGAVLTAPVAGNAYF